MISVQSRKQNMGTVSFKILKLFSFLFLYFTRVRSRNPQLLLLIHSFVRFVHSSLARTRRLLLLLLFPMARLCMYVRMQVTSVGPSNSVIFVLGPLNIYIYIYAPQTSYGWYHMVHSPRHHRPPHLTTLNSRIPMILSIICLMKALGHSCHQTNNE